MGLMLNFARPSPSPRSASFARAADSRVGAGWSTAIMAALPSMRRHWDGDESPGVGPGRSIVPDIGKANVVEMASHPPGRDRRAFLRLGQLRASNFQRRPANVLQNPLA
jgi:hypothetical protein